MQSVLELTMLLCFGFSWPFSICASYKAKTTGGKSIVFLWALILGYAVGIANKLIYSQDYVIFFYAANLIMVSIDTALWYRNHALDKNKAKQETTINVSKAQRS